MLGVVMVSVVLLCVDIPSMLSIYNIVRILRLNIVMVNYIILGVIKFWVFILFSNTLSVN